MKLSVLGSMALSGLVVAACSSAPEGDGNARDVSESTQEIVGPSKANGPNQVVMLYAKVTLADGSSATRTCSGAYFASRVVVTAAHCLDGASADQLFIYYGKNFAADFAQLASGPNGLRVPAPGQASNFAQADSFEQHPNWNPTQIYPDIAVVYLDRQLPFDPLPLWRHDLEAQRDVTISGWGANSAPTPTSGAGDRVQRTGSTRTLGSPSAADNHPEDPNPGLAKAANRANLIKTDGRAPNANPCFGDSGGPLLVRDGGQTYIAGVAYFGGVSCRDYGLYVRTNSFLPFLDKAAKKGGQEALKPVFECVAPNAQSTLTAFFGYKNQNGVSVAVPYGAKNRLALDVAKARPSRFLPGQHDFSFAVDFSGRQTISWTLSPDSSASITLNVDANSARCGADQADQIQCALACRASARSGCTGLPSFENCVSGCQQQTQFVAEVFPNCLPQNGALNACIAGLSPDPSNWLCYDGAGAYPGPTCQGQSDALNSCFSQ